VKNYLKQDLSDQEENNEICIGGGTDKTDKTIGEVGFVSFVSDHRYEYPEFFIDEGSAVADSLKPDSAVTLTYIVGNCPHCRQPLKVFSMGLSREVWIQCPTRPELFKALNQDEREWCRDCEMKKSVICGRCSECIQRLLLCPDEPCPSCGSVRFWRHRASRDRVAGFAWRCANCEEPMGKVVVYELTIEKQEGDESLCQQQPTMS
jgi:hypothetical protein